jgi:hypothetical protein
MSLTAARAGLDAILSGIDGINVYRRLKDHVEGAFAMVQWPETINPRSDLEGDWQFQIPVLVAVPYSEPETADARLEALIANTSGSVFYALDNGGDLTSTVDSTAVMSIVDIGVFQANDSDFLGCRIIVDVLGS